MEFKIINELKNVFKLSSEEIKKIINYIDLYSCCTVKSIDNPKEMGKFITLEHEKKFLDVTDLQKEDVEAVIQEKTELLTVIRGKENNLIPGKLDNIYGEKTLKKIPVFDPYSSYIVVKKINYDISVGYNKNYTEYQIVIYYPNKANVRKELKPKNKKQNKKTAK